MEIQDKKSQILDAGNTLFMRFGYSKTSLDDIAREAGIGKGTIYYYFESKEQIFLEVVQQKADYYFERLQEIVAQEPDFESKFKVMLKTPFKLMHEHAPHLIDAINNMPKQYNFTLQSIRAMFRKRTLSLFESVLQLGFQEGVLTDTYPIEKVKAFIYDWILLRDENITITNPEEFIRKADTQYEIAIHILLYGILKR